MTNGLRPAAADAAALTRAHMRAQMRTPQSRLNRKALGHAVRWADMVYIGLLCLSGAYSISDGNLSELSSAIFFPLALFAVLTPWLLSQAGLYRINPRYSASGRIIRAFIAVATAGTIALLGAQFMLTAQSANLAGFAVVAVLSITLLHCIYAAFIRRWGNAGRLASNIVLIGATANARKLISANAGSKIVNVVGIFDDRRARSPSQLAGIPYLGDTEDLFNWNLLPDIDRIVLTVTPKAEGRVQRLLSRLRALPQPVCLLLDLDGFDPNSTSLEDVVGVQAARMSGEDERLGHQAAKRVQDIVVGGCMFVAALPLMLLIGLAVRLTSSGPALFRQEREGFNGKRITVLKFRSMRHDPSPVDKPVRQVEFDDPRVTRIGGFLRKTSLDELPQLWNVLTGDMSLVGPRPHAPSMKTGGTETSKLVAEYAHRHRVKPGITGWAQVNGSRGPLHTPEAARERVRWDVDYIARASFWFDLWIMLRTLPALLGDKINIR